jgi:hypothetical protein
MTTNRFFNHYYAANEQDLIDDLIVESIQMQGLDIKYIPRTQDNIDYLYNEDPSNTFDSLTTIEMYPVSVEGFDGEQMMTIFGDEFKKSATFVVSRSRFKTEFPTFTRPYEGDLIFMPITNTVFEIKYVNLESPFFEKGKQYVYELKVEAFEYSHENVVTGYPDVDNILDTMNVENQDVSVEDFGQNDDIDDDADDDIVFDPLNPWGIR